MSPLALIMAIAGLLELPWLMALADDSQPWVMAWVSLDAVQATCLVAGGLLLLAGDRRAAPWARTAAAMLLLDGVLDIGTALDDDLLIALLMALLIELPLAVISLTVARKAARLSASSDRLGLEYAYRERGLDQVDEVAHVIDIPLRHNDFRDQQAPVDDALHDARALDRAA